MKCEKCTGAGERLGGGACTHFFNGLFRYISSWYTLWLVNCDSQHHHLVVWSSVCHHQDGQRESCVWSWWIRIILCFGQVLTLDQTLFFFCDLARGKDVFAFMPTGLGKSLIFQLFPRLAKAALTLENSTIIVVSPLISIMRDQVEHWI